MPTSLQSLDDIFAQDGMFPGVSLAEIPDSGAVYMQDILISKSGELRRRGPLTTNMWSSLSLPNGAFPVGVCKSAIPPDGVTRVGVVVYTSGTLKMYVYSYDTSLGTITSKGSFTLPFSTPAGWFSSSEALGGIGTWVGLGFPGGGVNTVPSQNMKVLWKGASKTKYSTGTMSSTRGATLVIGSGTTWTTNVEPGMFLFDASTSPERYLGVVKSVDSNTQLTLEEGALYTSAAASYKLLSWRREIPRYLTGKITTTTTSTAVTGAGTNFLAMSPGTSEEWHLYRAKDMGRIGIVSSVESATALTLTGNASYALTNEEYVAVFLNRGAESGFDDSRYTGWLTATHGGRQVYASNPYDADGVNLVWISDPRHAEAVDIAPAGLPNDTISVTEGNQGLSGIASVLQSLLIFKTDGTHVLVGATPSSMQLRKLHDDGCVSTNSIQKWENNVIWAGASGVYVYDGVKVTNLTSERLGQWWRDLTANLADVYNYGLYSMVAYDHYFLSFGQISTAPPSYTPYKGATAITVTSPTLAINLRTGAITNMTNLGISGSVQLPGYKDPVFLVSVTPYGTATGFRASALFELSGNDTFTTYLTGTAGPDFYLESKRYGGFQSLLKKLWKMVLLEYKSAGGTLSLDTLQGLDGSGTTASSTFPASSTFVAKRMKFIRRSQFFGFRLYQTSSAVTDVSVKAWQILLRPLRLGRT